ncbi:MAG TPA: SUMF1/EgtB/PvdO family nonheme iron enzyme [Thermoleophilaceae bacterium]
MTAPAAQAPPRVALGAAVTLPAGTYRLGEPGEERPVTLRQVLIGRWPVTNAHARRFFEATETPPAPDLAARLGAAALADHPVTGMSFHQAEDFCRWASAELGRPARLPAGDEWEAAARGDDGRPWPWGHTFDPDRCACAESGWGWTVPVTAHPDAAGPFGTEQQAGNVWEWVADRTPDGWRMVRGGSWLDHEWGVRASRALAADPARGTETTGFRIVIENSGREP